MSISYITEIQAETSKRQGITSELRSDIFPPTSYEAPSASYDYGSGTLKASRKRQLSVRFEYNLT
jgi:hypothetical protein